MAAHNGWIHRWDYESKHLSYGILQPGWTRPSKIEVVDIYLFLIVKQFVKGID